MGALPDASCPVCGGAPVRVHQAREMMYGLRDVFRYAECGVCPLLWRIDAPADWSRYYPKQYESFAPPRRGRFARVALRLRNRAALTGRGIFGRLVDALAPNPRLAALRPLQLAVSTRILDVGAGEGSTVRALRQLGYDHAIGLDPFLQADVVEKGRVLVHRRPFESAEGEFDVVMFHHSFEHMENPREVLVHARRILAPGGVCLLRIPVFPSAAWEMYGVDWVQLDAPRHAVLHSAAGIERLARETGFAAPEVRYDSELLQFWGSEQYAADLPLLDPATGRLGPRPGSLDRARRRTFARQAARLNRECRGDQAAFTLFAVG